MNEREIEKSHVKVIVRAWRDPEYKQRLIAEPAATLAEAGISVPEGVEVRVVEGGPEVRHFFLPPPPDERDLSDEDLEQIAAGSTSDTVASAVIRR